MSIEFFNFRGINAPINGKPHLGVGMGICSDSVPHGWGIVLQDTAFTIGHKGTVKLL